MYLVSVIIPVHNGAEFLDAALESVLSQSWKKSLEVSIFNDASTDHTAEIIENWKNKFSKENIGIVVGNNTSGKAGGVGYAKNKAVLQSNGKFLCFLDADDIMLNERIETQLEISQINRNAIVGSQYLRIPEGSTARYTEWSNSLTKEQLYTQIYTSFGPTLINPSWFLSREMFDIAGPYKELTSGFPEDLAFFYKHLNSGGKLIKVEKPLVIYRYHTACASFGVDESTIWNLRMEELEKNVLSRWTNFTIWNAGKQGRRFYRSLSEKSREKVLALCDVDEKKIANKYYFCELIRNEQGKPLQVPILHFRDATPPFIICVKLNLTGGSFEENLKSLQLTEGIDYFHFN